ncbi:MAG: type II toxin-antitoxin system VapC family toxin [Chloroflexi bacterium]|nr:type II toxin-antitoxin system VapC family toxin [Chloroflexota bacterium]
MSRTLVIDASLAIKSVLPGPLRTRIKGLLAGWGRSGDTIQVPALWRYETTSALSKGVHFKELSREQAVEALTLIAEIDVDVVVPDIAQIQRAFDWTLRLHRAAAYDSFYLALAETTSAGLWTADERLYNATKSLVSWVHWTGNDSNSA